MLTYKTMKKPRKPKLLMTILLALSFVGSYFVLTFKGIEKKLPKQNTVKMPTEKQAVKIENECGLTKENSFVE